MFNNIKIEKKLFVFSFIHIVLMIGIIVFGNPFFAYDDTNKGVLVALYYIVVVFSPIMAYLKIIDEVNPFSFLKLTRGVGAGIFKGIAIGVFIFVVFFIVNHFSMSINIAFKQKGVYMMGTIFVGLFEEISIRGFYLQKIQSKMGFIKANIISSVIFTMMHVMRIQNGENFLFTVVLYMVISLWLGYIFKKSQSLWTVIMVHAIYNFVIFIS